QRWSEGTPFCGRFFGSCNGRKPLDFGELVRQVRDNGSDPSVDSVVGPGLPKDMSVSATESLRNPPRWVSAVIWLAAFASPTLFFVLMLLANKYRINVPEVFVWSVLVFVPVASLIVCESKAWS